MINFSQEVCMVVRRGVVSVGSFLYYVVAESSSVTMWVSMEIRRAVLGHGLSPFVV